MKYKNKQEVQKLISKNAQELLLMYENALERKERDSYFWYLGKSYNVVFDNRVTTIKFEDDTIVCHDEDALNIDSYLVISSLDSVKAYIINNIKNKSEDEIIIIGGGEIYKEFLPYCNKIYMTKYNKSFENDTYFEIPNDIDEWEVTYKSEDEEYDGATFNFLTYERKAKDCTINEDGEIEWTIEPLNE